MTNLGRALLPSLAVQVRAARAELVDHAEGYWGPCQTVDQHRAATAHFLPQATLGGVLARRLTHRIAVYEAARAASTGGL
jgi:hypothetical protein